MSPQGFVKITDLIEWLLHDMKIVVTVDNIKHIVELDLKGRYKVADGQICAVNGHTLSLPLMTFAPYNHKIAGHPRCLVHQTYIKCLPRILKEGLSRMARNHVHFSMQPGKAGLQRKNKPTIAVYVDVMKALERGLAFQHFENDVIMCSGDKNGLISPFFFDRIQNTQTGALIEFDRPAAPLREDMIRPAVDKEIDVPPPWGATGFEPELGHNTVHIVGSARDIQNERSLLQARLMGIYGQDNTQFIERDLIGLAKRWNRMDSYHDFDNNGREGEREVQFSLSNIQDQERTVGSMNKWIVFRLG